jgi:hypothetical protein
VAVACCISWALSHLAIPRQAEAATAAASGRVRLWKAATGAAAGTLDAERDDANLDESLFQSNRPRDLSFSADGGRLAVRERDGVRVWASAAGARSSRWFRSPT